MSEHCSEREGGVGVVGFLLPLALSQEAPDNHRSPRSFQRPGGTRQIFYTSSRGMWAFPRALTYIYGINTYIHTSLVVEPACATVTSPQSEV
jgi:hypothetical protein